jgi:hypothetical protein
MTNLEITLVPFVYTSVGAIILDVLNTGRTWKIGHTTRYCVGQGVEYCVIFFKKSPREGNLKLLKYCLCVISLLSFSGSAYAVSGTSGKKIVSIYVYNGYTRLSFDGVLNGPYCGNSTSYAIIPIDGTPMSNALYSLALKAHTTRSTLYVEVSDHGGTCGLGGYPELRGLLDSG